MRDPSRPPNRIENRFHSLLLPYILPRPLQAWLELFINSVEDKKSGSLCSLCPRPAAYIESGERGHPRKWQALREYPALSSCFNFNASHRSAIPVPVPLAVHPARRPPRCSPPCSLLACCSLSHSLPRKLRFTHAKKVCVCVSQQQPRPPIKSQAVCTASSCAWCTTRSPVLSTGVVQVSKNLVNRKRGTYLPFDLRSAPLVFSVIDHTPCLCFFYSPSPAVDSRSRRAHAYHPRKTVANKTARLFPREPSPRLRQSDLFRDVFFACSIGRERETHTAGDAQQQRYTASSRNGGDRIARRDGQQHARLSAGRLPGEAGSRG